MLKKIRDKFFTLSNPSAPLVYALYLTKKLDAFKECSEQDFNEVVEWLFSLDECDSSLYEFCNDLIQSLKFEQPVIALQCYVFCLNRFGSFKQDNELYEVLKKRVLDNLTIGIAVVTYNRFNRLKETISRINDHTSSSFQLIVSDDGSTDGTIEWCAEEGISCITTQNTGVAANKNRALYGLHKVKGCDVGILLEDDCFPIQDGWEEDWCLAALVWGHVNYAHKILLKQDKHLAGVGSVKDPFISGLVGGACTATSQDAFNKVGFLNPRFKGYGCEHVEWSERYLKVGYNGINREKQGFVCLSNGLSLEFQDSYRDPDQVIENRKLKQELVANNDKSFVEPWLHDKEKSEFIQLVSSALSQQLSVAPLRELALLESQNNYFFVHVSKTAGTSFRSAIEDKFSVWADYGSGSPHTNGKIQALVHDEKDFAQLRGEINNASETWLAGHVQLSKYSDFVSARQIITFVREPIAQILSHYNHFVAHHGLKKGLEDFLMMPAGSNFQSHYVNYLPLGLIGYVGITESYDESLSYLNRFYNLNLATKKINVNSSKAAILEELEIQILEEIKKRNRKDIQLYRRAVSIHRERLNFLNEGKDWAYYDLRVNPNRVLVGCVYYSQSLKPVEIDVYEGDERIQGFVANGFYGGFPKANFPRDRYVGVHYKLPNRFKSLKKLRAVVKDTGQEIPIDLHSSLTE